MKKITLIGILILGTIGIIASYLYKNNAVFTNSALLCNLACKNEKRVEAMNTIPLPSVKDLIRDQSTRGGGVEFKTYWERVYNLSSTELCPFLADKFPNDSWNLISAPNMDTIAKRDPTRPLFCEYIIVHKDLNVRCSILSNNTQTSIRCE